MSSPFDSLFAPQQPLNLPQAATPPMIPQQAAPSMPAIQSAPQLVGPAPPSVMPTTGGLPQQPQGQQGQARRGFSPRDLAVMLGAVADWRSGTNGFTGTFSQLEQQQQAQDFARQQFEAQQANTSADNERQAVEQRLRTIPLLQGMLADEDIDSPEKFEAAMASARHLGSLVKIDPGYLERYRPKPDVFAQRKAQKRLAELNKMYSPTQMAQMEGFAVFEHDGRRVSLPELRQMAGVAGEGQDGKPIALTKPQDTTDVPLDRQAADALARGDMATYNRILRVKKDLDEATRNPRDPVAAELAALRLEQARQGQGQLPATVQRRVDAKSRAFENLPAVKRVNVAAEAASFARSLDINTKNPADDIALLYAFAKANDPDSVVREGEYATVQKYAQSWAEKVGFDAARIFTNTVFLSPQARANMKATIMGKFRASREQYDNVRRSYARQINQITKAGDGDTYLTDFGGAFPEDEDTGTNGGGGGAPGPNPFRRAPINPISSHGTRR